MEEATVQSNSALTRNPKNWLKLAIPLAVLAAAVIAYLLLVWWPAHRQPARHTYTKLEGYSITWAGKGQGISFSKPIELSRQTAGQNQVELTHIVNKNTAAHMAAASITSGDPLSKTDLLVLNSNLIRSDSKYHAGVVDPIKRFAADRLPKKWEVKTTVPKNFTGKTIKQDAWVLDVTARQPAGNKPPIKGKVVFAVIGNRYYYFMLAAPEYNWQSNQKVWGQVLDSLQIDQ